MKLTSKFNFVFALFAFLAAGSAQAAIDSDPSSVGNHCRPIRGYVKVEFTTENCTSPVGLCTKGRLWGDPLFSGHTSYVTEKAAGSSEDPTAQKSLTYSGTMKIATRLGMVKVTDLGLFDKQAGYISSQSRTLTGSGKLQGLTGVLFTIGSANSTGFISEVRGRACFHRNFQLP